MLPRRRDDETFIYAKATWRASEISNLIQSESTSDLDAKLEAALSNCVSNVTRQHWHLPLWILWRLWKSRNILIYQHENIPRWNNLSLTKNDVNEWLKTEEYTTTLKMVFMFSEFNVILCPDHGENQVRNGSNANTMLPSAIQHYQLKPVVLS